MPVVLPVPTRKVQENFSLSYIRSLCAQAALNIGTWEWDDGLDLMIGAAKSGFCGCRTRNIKYYLQVKSTYRYKIKHGSILFRLKLDKFRQLTEPSHDPQYLVVLLMPSSRRRWHSVGNKHAIWRRTAHFVEMRTGMKAFRTTAAYAWVLVPLTNRLSAGTLIEMYRNAWLSRKADA